MHKYNLLRKDQTKNQSTGTQEKILENISIVEKSALKRRKFHASLINLTLILLKNFL